jgi:hypothetical protein
MARRALEPWRTLDGLAPAHVPDSVIDDIKARERSGLVELLAAPGLCAGQTVRITTTSLLRASSRSTKVRDRVIGLKCCWPCWAASSP